MSRSAIDCGWVTYPSDSDLVCDGVIRERKNWTGYIMFSVRLSVDCY